MDKLSLPAEWILTSLDDVLLSIIGGGTPSKSNLNFYLGDIPWMSVKDMNQIVLEDTIDHISIDAVKNSSTNIIPAGTPIIATRMGLGKIVVANFDSAINQDLKALFLTKGIEREFFIGWYRSISKHIESLGTGTTVKGIRLEVLKALQFPLAPLAEQKVIAHKINIMLAQVEKAKKCLEYIPEMLKSFRHSILAAAVTGKLTEDWRSLNPTNQIKLMVEKYHSQKKGLLKVRGKTSWGTDVELYDLPVNWSWVENYKLAIDESNAICAGPFGTIFKAKDFRDSGIPIIFLRHVKEIGFNKNKPAFMDVKIWEKLHQDYSVYGGELLVTKLGDPPGECCIYPEENGVAMVTPDVIKMDVDERVANKKYLMYFFNSPVSKKMVSDAAFGATRLRIDISLFKLFPIPLPSLEEQNEIVRRVDEFFSYANYIEQKSRNLLERVNGLTQSILTKAFCGELTTSWRMANSDLISGENSAQALLKKIRIEHEELKKQPKKKHNESNLKSGNKMSRKIITVVEALKQVGKPLSGQQLLAAAGYSSDSNTEDLERFFLDIRESLTNQKSITRLERSDDGQDWFSLTDSQL
ncbi:restriction endonuclease subunit S [Salmonella enterica]|nr:restriction endonuclease subunit S [Salmonella enterica]EFP4633968.1 restriction endonuclease subunit S [Salmonella enterica]EFS0362428.1 restriction endonuclease subunit S [Salmonella enterica]EGK1504738.1 restriction endonuclease subunit S [Salmonella enterica]